MILIANEVTEKPFEWHFGDGRPYINFALIISITADGEELKVIKREFGLSIPIGKGDEQTWFGDIAATILHTICSYKPLNSERLQK